MQICQACGHSNVDLAIFCANPECRTLLRWNEASAVSKGAFKARDNMAGETDGVISTAESPGERSEPVETPAAKKPPFARVGQESKEAPEGREPEAETPPPPSFAAVKPGARPRPPDYPTQAGEEEPEAPEPESTRAERARFLAMKPGERRPGRETIRPGVEVPPVGVNLSLAPTECSLDPGAEASFEVLVRNTGTIVDQFTIQVNGDAARWASVEPSTVNLYPDSDAAVVTLRFSPPHSPFTPAGPARFEVRAVSAENSNISAAARGVVNVAPFYALSAGLVPHASEGRRYGDHRLTIANQGNTRVNATLSAGDPDSRLRFNMNPSAVTADPGTEVASEVQVRPRKSLWLGNPVLRPFEVTGTGEGAPPVRAEGQFQHIPLIPKWVPRVAIVVVPLLVALVTYLVRTAKLPDVGGSQLVAAQRTLTDAGFKPTKVSEATSPDVPKGAVISATAAKKPGLLGRTPKGQVTVVTSKGVEVPAVDQLDEAGATAKLQDAGLNVASVQSVANKAEAGIAVATVPGPKTFVNPGSNVTLLLSSGMATAAVNPTSLAMPGEPVGVASEPQTVTVANQGNGELSIGSVAIGGANAADFTVTSNTCQGTPVPKGGNCLVLVTFTPGAAGPRTGALTMSSNGGNSSVTMTGTGLTAEIGLGAANLNFESQKVGTPSNAQTVTVTNKGSAPMAMKDATVSGGNPKDFALTDGCKGNTVAPGSACSVAVVFTPAAKGASSGRLTVTNAAGGAQTVALAGKGTVPEATVDPLSVDISKAGTGVVTLTNTGDAPMTVGVPTIRNSDKFGVVTNECRNELAPKATCKIAVKWDADTLAPGQTTSCWQAALVVPTDDPVKRDVLVGLVGDAKLAKNLAVLNLPLCGV